MPIGWAEHHVAGIVDDDVDTAGVADDMGDTGIGRGGGLHIQFDGAQIRFVFGGPGGDSSDLRRITAVALPHRGVDAVPGHGQSLRRRR